MVKRNVKPVKECLYMARQIDKVEEREVFLITCEGAKTEPHYFEKFRVPGRVVDVRGLGDNTLGVVLKALELKQKKKYDQVWCVFDRDSFPASDFNAAFELAKNNNIKIAYSNEAFEIWYLLHFNYCDAACSRAGYAERLTEQLGFKSEKNSKEIYDILLDRQGTAIKNAQRLLATYNPLNRESANPSTEVHLLVIELNKSLSS